MKSKSRRWDLKSREGPHSQPPFTRKEACLDALVQPMGSDSSSKERGDSGKKGDSMCPGPGKRKGTSSMVTTI